MPARTAAIFVDKYNWISQPSNAQSNHIHESASAITVHAGTKNLRQAHNRDGYAIVRCVGAAEALCKPLPLRTIATEQKEIYIAQFALSQLFPRPTDPIDFRVR